ncbi:MAG: AIR synthase-related protein, partial [Methanomassiliicoccales archaeon]|nr:AIR synthase-related protein [Methanomassiliicoccales archaeon]
KEGALLSASGAITSCMDTSDGLSTSLYELAEASGVCFEVSYDNIPVDMETRQVVEGCGTELDSVILHGGGDYQLLFTVRPEGWDDVQKLLGKEVTVIGRCLEGKVNTLKRGSSHSILESRGYEHFRHRS